MWAACGACPGSACPSARCNNFLKCPGGKPGDAGPVPEFKPQQEDMNDGEDARRCRLSCSASMPRLRYPASAGADFWRTWVLSAGDETGHSMPLRTEVSMPSRSSCAALLEVAPNDKAKQISLTFDQAGPLGIRLNGARYVQSITETGLAHGCGLLPDDRLTEIGGKSVEGADFDQIVDMLGRRPVALTFERGGPTEEETPPSSPERVKPLRPSPAPAVRSNPEEETRQSQNPKRSKAGNGSTRRFSAPPARRSRSTKCPRQRWSYPARGNRGASQDKQAKCTDQDEAPEIFDVSLATAVPPGGLQVGDKTLPRPPCGHCWDWPLTRNEKKARILLIDKTWLMMDRKSMQEEIQVLRSLETPWC